ncbi:MAG: hypothetical protein KDB22_19830 [Planctomycetales bacterium]|nr:hypothetical protein [Planctomycetales bacterium]MCA9184689.1 hypothetical protein [Planctomycetales bacterium]
MRILLTAFEPYGDWSDNSSWLALVELLRNWPNHVELVTRRYPVDLATVRSRLNSDLQTDFDAVLHLGQAPGSPIIKLEAMALNVAGCLEQAGVELPYIVDSAPMAFRSRMPLATWNHTLAAAGIPSQISYHAGTYLCNAIMYLSHYYFYTRDLNTPVGLCICH